MKSEIINLQPARQLLDRHTAHVGPYATNFKNLDLIIQPEVFNPSYTKVSGFLADNILITPGSKVLDIFTGCGAIAILAAKMGASSVLGTDVSPAAVDCARQNASRNCVSGIANFFESDLWKNIPATEKYDIITANPPLLPVRPETPLEMTIADSPEMALTVGFLRECGKHIKDKKSSVFMTFSNACKAYYPNPMAFIEKVASENGLRIAAVTEWDVGYEIYRVIRFMLN